MRKSSRAVGARRGRLSSPWLRFHGGGAADVYIIIRVRASGCGESALNPPTSPPIPRRRSAPAPAQRRALPEHFFTPSPPRRTPADLTTHFPPKTCSRPAQRRTLPAHFHSPRSDDARPPTSQPIPHRRSSPFPSIFSLPSRALPLPRPATMHARRPHNPFPTEDLRPPPHNDTPFLHTSAPPPRDDARPQAAPCTPADPTTHSPSKTFARPRTTTRPSPALLPHPRSADARPQAARCIPRRPHNTFPAEGLLPPPHNDAPCPSTSAPPSCALPPAPAQRHALPEHFRSPSRRRRTPAGCAMHSSPTPPPIPRRRPSPAPAQRRALPEHFLIPFPCPPATSPQPRRTPAGCAIHSSSKISSPPLLFRFGHKKNGTAQWMCDAECLGRPSLRSVIWVGEPRAVRRRCGALAWRVGLRPRPWALRSRRCGRVLRA